MRVLFLFNFILVSLYSFSQLSIDSLRKELNNNHADTTLVKTYIDLSWEYLSYDLDTAGIYAQEALNLSENINDDKAISKSLYQLGVVNYYSSNLEKSIENLVKAIKIDEKYNDVDGIKKCKNVIGAVYLANDQFNKAKIIFRELYRESLLDKDSSSIESAISNIAACCFKLHEYDSCIYYTNMYRLYPNHDRHNAYDHLSATYDKLNMLDSALYYNNKALNLNNKNKDVIIYLQRKGSILRKLGEFKEAIKVHHKVISICNEIGNIDLVESSYNALASTYEEQGKYDSALHYHRKFVSINDSILTMSNTSAIAEINTKYQTEKKELEIVKQKAELEKHRFLEYGLAIGIIMLLALGATIYNRYREKNKANELLTSQKEEIELKNFEIMDSLKYAKRIQHAILPPDKLVTKYLDESFVLYTPKDIVSGDFYWMNGDENKLLFAAVDCTGHGVPGAFISIVGYNGLNKMIGELKLSQPAEILTNLNKHVADSLHQQENAEVKDGMDISLCLLDKKNKKLQFSGANNPLYIIRNGELLVTKGDKMAIGSYYFREDKFFTNHEIDLQEGDCIYTFTDGYADQFGGPNEKKFMSRQFKELLISIAPKPMDEQKKILISSFEQWKGSLEQVDDICIIGVRF